MAKKKKNLGRFLPQIRVGVVVVLCVAGFILGSQWSVWHKPLGRVIELKIDRNIIPNAFVAGYPDFDNLTMRSFRDTHDRRNMFPYKNHIIVVGLDFVYEIDPSNSTLVRRLRPDALPCANWGTVIGSNLYILCYSGKYGVFQIDLETGNLVKSYTNYTYLQDGRDTTDFKFGNASIVSMGNMLWLGGPEGVISINTKNDQVRFYTDQEIGIKAINGYEVFATKEYMGVVAYGHESGVSIYNPRRDTWTRLANPQALPEGQNDDYLSVFGVTDKKVYFIQNGLDSKPTNIAEYSLAGGLKPVVSVDPEKLKTLVQKYPDVQGNTMAAIVHEYLSGLQMQSGDQYINDPANLIKKFVWSDESLPRFNALSNRVGDTYYLTENKSIWKLTRGAKYPVLFYKANLSMNRYFWPLYVTQDGQKIVLFGQNEHGGPGEFDLNVYILHTDTKKLVDISPLPGVLYGEVKKDTNLYSEISVGGTITYQQNSDLLTLVKENNKGQKLTVGVVDLAKDKFSFK